MAQIRLVVTDEDGTFLRDHVSYDRERFERLWVRMQELSIRFCVATGNQCYQVQGHFAAHAHEMGIISANGAYVLDGDEEVFSARCSDEARRKMIQACHARPEVPFSMLGVKAAYVERTCSQEFFDDMATYCTRQYWVDDYETVDDQIFMFSSVVDEDKVAAEIDYFTRLMAGDMDVVGSGEGYFDVICPNVNKGTGLSLLLERYGIAPEEVVCFGDSDNDLEMIELCGLSYAMADAAPNVQSRAKAIAPPSFEDGVLQVLEELLY